VLINRTEYGTVVALENFSPEYLQRFLEGEIEKLAAPIKANIASLG
jgi:hypothetical protein